MVFRGTDFCGKRKKKKMEGVEYDGKDKPGNVSLEKTPKVLMIPYISNACFVVSSQQFYTLVNSFTRSLPLACVVLSRCCVGDEIVKTEEFSLRDNY